MTSTHRLIGIGLIWFSFMIVGFFTVNSIFLASDVKLQLSMLFAVVSLVATWIVARAWMPASALQR
ncbi:MAG: hypothetical protein KF726_24720 [Anaerolineae bacterium]|nr:hypothetical protein [Anaerolineae bacterium]